MPDQGYTRLFSLAGAQVRLHFTVVFGLLYLSGPHFRPGTWLGYLVVILGHELGHALLARRYGLRVSSVDIHGFGGVCVHQAARSVWQDSVIAWGGVLMQLLFFAGAWALLRYVVLAGHAADFASTLLTTNLVIAGLNLLPLNGLDGAAAWRLPRLAYQSLRKSSSVASGSGRGRKLKRRPLARASTRVAVEEPRPAQLERGEVSRVPNLRLVRDGDGDFRFEAAPEDEEQEN
jgi:stage IV sporulation protein FB